MSSSSRLVPCWLAAVALAACGDATSNVFPPPNLDRPVDIAFSCWGGLRLVGDNGTADADDPIVQTGQPMDACRIRAYARVDSACKGWLCDGDPRENAPLPDDPPPTRAPGQEALDDEEAPLVPELSYFAFVLQSVPGTVAILKFDPKPPISTTAANAINSLDVNFQDADLLTPGRNSVPVGDLPVAIATDRASCHVVTANAGSCDLSVVDIDSVVDDDEGTPIDVRRVDVLDASGAPVLARPAAMVAEPVEADQPIGVECPAEPEGLVYVAYPDCHLVAAVRASTGVIEAGILFNADGTITLTTGAVSCPAQCGAGGTLTPGPHPSTLDLVHDRRVDTRRLAIGAEDSPVMAIVELGPDYLPLSFSPVPLVGGVGVLDVALSPQIGMGGSAGLFDDEGTGGGQHQFIYAVATDQTVRVADVLGTAVECDTQIDPRFLRAEVSPSRLACMPVGDPATPRRALARGPGIEVVGGPAPIAVAIAPSLHYARIRTAAPGSLQGYFAFVATTAGDTVIVTIDDDKYGDTWTSADPLLVQMPLAAAHQVRDNLEERDKLPLYDEDPDDDVPPQQHDCDNEGYDNMGGPHTQNASITIGYDSEEVNQEKRYVLPTIHRVLCEGRGGPDSISELSFQVMDYAQRDRAFPDLRAVRGAETWFLTWEGPLSRDSAIEYVDGPIVRSGLVERIGGEMSVRDPSRPFCEVGAQPGDLLVLAGCDPSLGDGQCGLGETCYVHPDSQTATGACLPSETAEELAATCRDFLTTMRKYSVRETSAGELRVVPRRHMLTTSPVDGCVSDDQCMQLAQYEASLASSAHPADDATPPPARTYRCEPDVTRPTPLPRCMQVCETSDQCDPGTACSGGYCIEAVLPAPECVTALERYEMRAGDAITVLGDLSGYLHPIIENPVTGKCEPDANASPLLIGRIPLNVPPCPGPDDYSVLTPNPCLTTVTQTEPAPVYEAGGCTVGDGNALVSRDAPAIRFKNPIMTFHLVDPWYPGDAMCREDRAGTLDKIPTVHPGYQYTFPVIAGFVSIRAPAPTALPARVVRGPEDSIWVIDEGDGADESGRYVTRGQVYRFEPSDLVTTKVNNVE